MAVALRGNLQDFGIAEVFQLIGQQRKTGLLGVTHGGTTVRLAFDAGRVVWGRPVEASEDAVLGDRLVRCGLITQARLEALRAESTGSARTVASLAVDSGDVSAEDASQIDELVTHETIFIVLRWSEGSFDFSAQAVRHDRPEDKLLAAEQILMDGLRMVDEWQTFAALVPDGDTVFERSGPLTLYKRDLAGEAKRRFPTVERVYGLVDGRLTAQRIIDLSRLGLFDATRALAELHSHNVIAPLSKRQARARRRGSEESLAPILSRVRWLVAASVPMVLLAGVVSGIVHVQPTAEVATVFPIVRAPLEDARVAFEKRRVQQALEAGRLLTGSWPAGISGDDPTGLLEGDALTPADRDPYYYARRGGGYVLLAPAR